MCLDRTCIPYFSSAHLPRDHRVSQIVGVHSCLSNLNVLFFTFNLTQGGRVLQVGSTSALSHEVSTSALFALSRESRST